MNNELTAMKTFMTVVDMGSFSAAGHILGVAQSGISRRVRDLESDLQVALLIRTTREVRPTEAGVRYYEAARDAIAAVDSARAVAQTEARTLSGTLRVGCSTLFGDTWLAPRLSDWIQQHPGIRLDFQLRDNFVDLVSAGLDLSIRFNGPQTTELRGRRLRTYRRYLMASPRWVEQHGWPLSPGDLTQTRCLVFGRLGARGWVVHNGQEKAVIRPRHPITATTGGFLDTLARQDVGPVLIPEWIGEQRQASGELVRLLPDWEGEQMTLWVVWPNHSFQSAAARQFLTWVVEQTGSP